MNHSADSTPKRAEVGRPRRFYRRLAVIMSLLFLLAACSPAPAPMSHNPAAAQLFPETGHTVKGEFLQFFERYGGVESLGYPLSAEIVVAGWRVQYFEKGRLEYHPENEPAYRLTVGWLGDLLQRRRPPIPAASIPAAHLPGRRYYRQTGHTLSGDFLTYFDGHGGSVRFGLPISEPFLWQDRLTQDFQSARFFWAPETKDKVILEEIGRLHLEAIDLLEK
jgi:hypothetical protein